MTSGSSTLDNLFWRDEILETMYWMCGEGLAEDVDAAELTRFLVSDVDLIQVHLDRLVASGDLTCEHGRYRLTEQGRREGAVRFRDAFADLTRPAHGECAPGYWCHDPVHAGEPCPSHPDRPAV